MSPASPVISAREEEERQELEAVLRSGIFTKAPNLKHFLDFVANRYFAGEAEQLKEYSIAVHALNRPETFDPQSDTVVRVTAHTLRKKLQRYYANEGRDHPIQIQLPPGKYVLHFVHKSEEASSSEVKETVDVDSIEPNAHNVPDRLSYAGRKLWNGASLLWGALLVIIMVVAIAAYLRSSRKPIAAAGPAPTLLPNPAKRFLLDDEIPSYTDAAGQVWNALHGCTGGTLFSHPEHEINGTDDPQVYRSGREGRFTCKIPAAPGSYQVRVLFADTENDKEAARQVVFTINSGPVQAIDVVDDAGGNDTAFAKVYSGIHPMSDGSIHLDFLSEGAFANAVEITPTVSDMEPTFRMVAGPAVVRDVDGNIWNPESFFVGGRRTFHPDVLSNRADSRLYQWERYGHFHYSLPVSPGKPYTVRLYFSEGWFGQNNGGPGGVGSRIFDVYGDGTTLLKNYDILKQQKNGAVVETIHHVMSSSHGMLDLYFTPVENYALINAIEIEPEN